MTKMTWDEVMALLADKECWLENVEIEGAVPVDGSPFVTLTLNYFKKEEE